MNKNKSFKNSVHRRHDLHTGTDEAARNTVDMIRGGGGGGGGRARGNELLNYICDMTRVMKGHSLSGDPEDTSDFHSH